MARRRKRLLPLDTLLRTGRWGQIRTGISRQVLVGLLGQPDDWAVSDAEHELRRQGHAVAGWALSTILRYGGVEFHFPPQADQPCWLVFCDDLDRIGRPFAGGWLAEGLPLAQVEAALADAGLTWEQQPFPQAPDQLRLVLGSGARLGLTTDASFFDTPGEGPRLFCVEVVAVS